MHEAVVDVCSALTAPMTVIYPGTVQAMSWHEPGSIEPDAKSNDQSSFFPSPVRTANSNHCSLFLRFYIASNSDGSV